MNGWRIAADFGPWMATSEVRIEASSKRTSKPGSRSRSAAPTVSKFEALETTRKRCSPRR